MSTLKLVIRDTDHLLHSGELAGPLELGRQRKDEPSPSAAVPCPFLPGAPARLLLAPTTENNIGRQHVLLEPLDSGNVRVHNGSQIALAHDHGSIVLNKPVEPLDLSCGYDRRPARGRVSKFLALTARQRSAFLR